jgi:hypothetical protein
MYDKREWADTYHNPLAIALIRNDVVMYEWLGAVLPNIAGIIFDTTKNTGVGG